MYPFLTNSRARAFPIPEVAPIISAFLFFFIQRLYFFSLMCVSSQKGVRLLFLQLHSFTLPVLFTENFKGVNFDPW